MRPIIRFTISQIDRIKQALCADLSAENACFAYCTPAEGEGGRILVVQ